MASPEQMRKMEAEITKYINIAPIALYDIGIGHKTEWKTLHDLYPEMLLFGCEPLLNHYPHMAAEFPGKIKQVAVGDVSGNAKVYIRPEVQPDECASMIDRFATGAYVEVPLWTLDQFDEWAGSQENVILWMDIEGLEYAALRGGTNLLQSGRVKWINLEERKEWEVEGPWSSPCDIVKLLNNYGYVRTLEYHIHKAHQDVIYVHESTVK